jgi:hypothetical protein
MAGDFTQRIDELRHRVGSGRLEGKVTVDQVYARYQHEGLELGHPRGGMARYLSQPLLDNHSEYLQTYADRVFNDEDGGRSAFVEAMENLAEEGGVATFAPVEFSNLRASGHPEVHDGEDVVYDRPPRQARLTEEEIRELKRLHPTGWITLPNGQHVFIGIHP